MTEKVEPTPEGIEKIRREAAGLKNAIVSFAKKHSAEVKGWRFAVESNETGYLIDFSGKVLIKPHTHAEQALEQ